MVLLKKPILIGVAGGSASGKTSLSEKIYKAFEKTNSIIIIKEDDYYKDQSSIPFNERVNVNYDHPFAFDHDLLVEHLKALMKGQRIQKPTYDYTIHNRSNICEDVDPCDVIIVEGLFVLENKELRNLLDIKLFVDTPADVRFIRRLLRDVNERGRQLESIIKQYLSTVRIMHDEFVEPSKKYADLIIPEGGKNIVAIDILTTKISSIINEKML